MGLYSKKVASVIMLGCLLIGNVTYATEPKTADDFNKAMSERFSIIEKDKKEETKKEYIEVDCEITFYTSLLCENTHYGAVDAQSNPLKWGTIAIPRDYELGTKFEFDGIDGTFTGTDRGSKKHIKVKSNGVIRIDMFVPRNKGESDDSYYERVNNYGRFKTKGRILIGQDSK